MVKVSGFEIINFKGIERCSIAVEGGKSPGRFVTLIGLNEGGKTSIIEAISQSVLQDPDTSDLLEATSTSIDMADVVPKHRSAGFTGRSEVSVKLDFSDEIDYKSDINKIFKKHNIVLDGPLQSTITMTKWYSFVESAYENSGSTWNFMPSFKKPTGTKIYNLYKEKRTVWLECVNEIKKLLPRSVYFPTFLVKFPSRIYLEGDYGKVDNYYRAVIKDAMNGLSPPLNINKHIIERVNKHRKGNESFSSSLRSSVEGSHINATVQAIVTELNRVVFGAWEEIFNKPVKNRKIVAEWHIDESKDNHVYLEFFIIAGDHRFLISERSLGFRWFFSFLLFTQFQGSRFDNRKVVFLFDEPASHLHPKAQERLLKSFEKIAHPNHIIMYSTHSHYLVNPLWLEQAYIVSNASIDADDDDTGINEVGSRVKISAKKYKSFVSDNPSKTTYYQPVIDVLDHGPGALDISDPVVILEGKFDYYPFKFLLSKSDSFEKIKVIPAVGAGGLSALIGILRGWNVRFLVLLDDDDAGRKEKAKYKDVLMLTENQVVTLDELSIDLHGKEFEGIFQSDIVSSCIAAGFGEHGKLKKQNFYSYFQTLQCGNISEPEMQDTLDIFNTLLSGIMERIEKQ